MPEQRCASSIYDHSWALGTDYAHSYTIAWKRTSSPSLALDNAVEFKSLPSGLHAQQSDLVYFTHEGYAGLGAFAQGSAGAEDRNANFVSVGVLVKKDGEYGRLGRAWLVAGRLEALAKGIADGEGVDVLEGYWEECMGAKGKEKEGGKANGDKKTHSRARATSTASAIPHGSDERLPPFHPALSILTYIDVFGPLVFRLQQAALLRKRILFVGAPPVRAMCDFGTPFPYVYSHVCVEMLTQTTGSIHHIPPLLPHLPLRRPPPPRPHAPTHALQRRRPRHPRTRESQRRRLGSVHDRRNHRDEEQAIRHCSRRTARRTITAHTHERRGYGPGESAGFAEVEDVTAGVGAAWEFGSGGISG